MVKHKRKCVSISQPRYSKLTSAPVKRVHDADDGSDNSDVYTYLQVNGQLKAQQVSVCFLLYLSRFTRLSADQYRD